MIEMGPASRKTLRRQGKRPWREPRETLDMMESLILAQDERWRRASHMQVERGTSVPSGGRVSNTWATYPPDGDNSRKRLLIPDTVEGGHPPSKKGPQGSPVDGLAGH